MHLALSIVSGLLKFLTIAILSSMLGAQAWAVSVLRAGRSLLPPAPPRPARWGIGTTAAVFLTYILLNATAYSIVAGIAGPGPAAHVAAGRPGPAGAKVAEAPADPSFTAQMLGYTLGNALSVVVLPLLVQFLARVQHADMGLTLDRLRHDAGAGAVAFLLVTPWIYVVSWLANLVSHAELHTVEKMLRQEASFSGVVLAFVSAVIFAPLAEELVFRGIIQAWLNRAILYDPIEVDPGSDPDLPAAHEGVATTLQRDGAPGDLVGRKDAGLAGGRAWAPVVASSLLFAAMHVQVMPTPIPLFFLALALGYLYQRTGSLVAPITLHALFNAFSTLELLRILL
jgi:membrane protease YdiL (CAAX protease family)